MKQVGLTQKELNHLQRVGRFYKREAALQEDIIEQQLVEVEEETESSYMEVARVEEESESEAPVMTIQIPTPVEEEETPVDQRALDSARSLLVEGQPKVLDEDITIHAHPMAKLPPPPSSDDGEDSMMWSSENDITTMLEAATPETMTSVDDSRLYLSPRLVGYKSPLNNSKGMGSSANHRVLVDKDMFWKRPEANSKQTDELIPTSNIKKPAGGLSTMLFCNCLDVEK